MRNTLFIGGGNMAFAIIGGLIQRGVSADSLRVVDTSELACANVRSLGVQASGNWPEDFDAAQVVLAVKPQAMQAVLEFHASRLTNVLIISIAAGISVAQLREWSTQLEARVARCMPNTPALVSLGMTGVYFTNNCSADDKSNTRELFSACGQLIEVDQEQAINAVTAISGSGPGYVFFMMEALAQAARNMGFTQAQSTLLVSQTFLGAATLAQHTGEPFSQLRDKVTSKGGTTFAGLEAFRSAGLDHAIEQGAQAALARAIELQKGAR